MRKALCLLILYVCAAIPAFSAGLQIDSGNSQVSVDFKASPPHTFTCDLQNYDAVIDVDPADGSIKSARFSFQLTDLETYNEKRNKKMFNWMDVDQYNTITWNMTSMEIVDGSIVAHGDMSMHGESQPVDVVFNILQEAGVYTISGTADFDYTDFGLPKIKLFIFSVNPDLHVHFSLNGVLESE